MTRPTLPAQAAPAALTSPAEVETALAALATLHAFEELALAAARKKILDIGRALQEQLVVELQTPGRKKPETVAIRELRERLETAILEYAQAHREELFPGRGKTAKFAHGEVRIRKQTAGLVLAEGATEESVLSRLSSPRHIRTRSEIDFVALKGDREKGLLSDDQLAALGLAYVPGADGWSVSLADPLKETQGAA